MSRGQQVIFFREGGWYPVEIRRGENVAQHAELNPGTLRVEDLAGNILWRSDTVVPFPAAGGRRDG